ncbi:hypothetical protein KAJ61_04035 [Candidatus Parcubacteria bacterium]|nr:hypothetical protein [Candidatus Parcubacteria bacterium]
MLKKKITILVLILAVVTVVSGCGKKQSKITTGNEIMNSQQDNKEQNQATIILEEENWKNVRNIFFSTVYDSKNWNEYKSEKNNVILKYKKDWVLADLGDIFVGPSGWKVSYEHGEKKEITYFSISTKKFKTETSIQQILDYYNKNNIYKESYVIYNDKKSILLTFDENNIIILCPFADEVTSIATKNANLLEVKEALSGIMFIN